MAQTEGRLEVRAIENGTVIDHIPASSLFQDYPDIGTGAGDALHYVRDEPRKQNGWGPRAIIKINDRFCEQEEINPHRHSGHRRLR